MRRGRSDRVALIEAAYAPAISERAWLAGLAEAGRSACDGIVGAYGFCYEGLHANVTSLDRIGSSGIPERTISTILRVRSLVPERFRAASDRQLPAVHTSGDMIDAAVAELPSLPRPAVDAAFSALSASIGLREYIGLNALAPAGGGCLLGLFAERPLTLTPPLRRSLERVSAHLLAGLRLRRWKDELAIERGDAVLDPDGRVVHAEGDARERAAREALTEAAVRSERARGGLRSASPDEAVEIWAALVSGRWSLVDHWDTDGRRFLLARRNPPDVVDLKALTEPERQVIAHAALGHSNKLIAYELGLSASTVATHLAAALPKLGLASRTELIRFLGQCRRAERS